MNKFYENPVLCDLCEEFIQTEDARIVCPDFFTAAQNIPPCHPIEKAPKDGTHYLSFNLDRRFYITRWMHKAYPVWFWRGAQGELIPSSTPWMPLHQGPKDGE